MSNIKEAELVFKSGYYKCPASCGAIYHTYSFTHRTFQCKDCGTDFKVPDNVKLNKPKIKRTKKVQNG